MKPLDPNHERAIVRSMPNPANLSNFRARLAANGGVQKQVAFHAPDIANLTFLTAAWACTEADAVRRAVEWTRKMVEVGATAPWAEACP